MTRPNSIRPPEGRLAVLLPGMGAISSTFITGVLLARKGLGLPVGSLTQMGTLHAGGRSIRMDEYLPLARMEQLVFGGWDIFPDSVYETALHAKVLEPEHLGPVREELEAIRPMKGVFHPQYVKRLHGTHVKTGATKAELVEQVRADIRAFLRDKGCARAVAIWCGSTETYVAAAQVHASRRAFEAGLRKNDPSITNSQLYAWACLQEGVPFANGSPNLAVDFPAAAELARHHEVALAGKDFKTGQTLMKTVIAPALKARMLGVRGWFSTNILGNRDGEVLDDPESFRAKEITKRGVLEDILQSSDSPALYGELFHKVRIEYYPPRGDAKEGWDNIDLFGWLGYPMQMKIDFLCRDSILAAPLVLDLALLMDLAQRAGRIGTQDWLGFYFKSPMTEPGRTPEQDLFVQERRLKDSLRALMGETTGAD
ncbi:inositol-3-phosphate synthase [Melittangium boletus]|uniref:Inositol-3-phosphate synthase n=1 Tax=Melittangium boletus DSM 14713 TaxID=1294270 RepID=A0A250ID66_9BACT|nr:inositol-3-phosphate synthase [Melittangium boletus]ATB28896.1 inositol-3-phosphate synthase [Melittangium boletus DSM 14713]